MNDYLIKRSRHLYNSVLGTLAFICVPSYLRIYFLRLKGVSIGKNTFIGRFVNIDDRNPELIKIGSKCGIATGVVIFAHRRKISPYNEEFGYSDYPILTKEVIIEDNVQIGANTIILPGVTIGKAAIIGAGSVLTKSIPAYSMAFGIPAKVIRTLKI